MISYCSGRNGLPKSLPPPFVTPFHTISEIVGGKKLSKLNNSLIHDIRTYILENGTSIDLLRLAYAGYEMPSDALDTALENLKSVQNPDGGLPFDLVKGNPSSAKLTAEVIPLLKQFKELYPGLHDNMVSFLISRQKSDGGFAETLNLDSYIEDKYGSTEGREWYPVGKSITWLTGKALEALVGAEYADEERLRRARDFLMYSQNEDGHWPDYKDQNESDPLGTGNILPALLAAGVDSNHKVYRDGRAALFHHLVMSIESNSTYDMVDLTAVGKPESPQERDVILRGLNLIMVSQNHDGGWAPMGTKKSDPELSSILAYVARICAEY